jgi:hypothetical protein
LTVGGVIGPGFVVSGRTGPVVGVAPAGNFTGCGGTGFGGVGIFVLTMSTN